ncbi:MAG: tRNA lysidine(34) synthetase TilS [Acidimicrobiia bacterium]|nr:tRNA lysidine(34) synthetase TilS [Acidimicrobiia bacterium]
MPSDGDLLDRLTARCTFPAPGTEVVCAVSGGADSLALLALAGGAGLAVTAVHVDHGLRPGSAAEADVVAAAAERFGARFRSETVVVEPGSDLENRARQARHRVLGPDAMTGHTADDQAETVLINLLRGAGLDGIAAMEPGFRHPILGLRRAETVALCAQLRLEPVDDPSNHDPRFVRNRIRHEALPLLADISDRDPVPLLIRTADHARRVAADLTTLAAALDPTDCRALREALPSVAHQALRRWLQGATDYPPTAAELERVMTVVRGEAVACEIEPGFRIARSGQQLSAGPASF